MMKMAFGKKPICLLLGIVLAILLTGCVAAVVVTAAGMAVYDRRGVITLERDARIFHLVRKGIVTDPRFYDSHIVVSSFNQVVLLTGQTPVASLRVIAEKIAQSVPNVRRVYDEISVGSPLPMAKRTKDSLITGEIRSLMFTKKGLESGSIRIITEDSVVYLMGIVTNEQADLAVEVARQVKGVNKVVKIFQYIH